MPPAQRRDRIRRALSEWPFLIKGPSEPLVDLCDMALMHDSYVNELRDRDPSRGLRDNERLEFLGDAVLELIVRESLFLSSDMREGDMTLAMQSLISNASLASRLRESPLDLEALVLTGEGHDALSDRMLSGAFEAIVGALYLGAGLATARMVCRRMLGLS